jgi:NTP pyrophosphatase (non-canonical NTP hydrolase)
MDNGKLDFDAYQQHALRTARDKEGPMALSVGGMGLGGEGAELLELFLTQQERFLEAARVVVTAGKTVDYLKKVVHHDHPIDKEKVKKELGDLLWYIAITAHASGLSFNDVASANVEKLKARYAKGFTVAESLNRKPGDS